MQEGDIVLISDKQLPGIAGLRAVWKPLTLSYTAIIGIASFTAVAENGRCKNNGI